MSGDYQYDEKGTRLKCVKAVEGSDYNWLFFPGGPGGDSCYYEDLIDELNHPGKYWLIDFPHNGSAEDETVSAGYDYDQWFECMMHVVKSMSNPIVVGHSAGAMFPLLRPELENLLSGFMILNSTPTLWLERATELAVSHGLPDVNGPMGEFIANPSKETFKVALMACADYYFPPELVESGREMLGELSFNYHAAQWWQVKALEMSYSATWVPQSVPTTIIGGTIDYITPVSLFEEDARFKRDNIHLHTIEGAGHFPWLTHLDIIQSDFTELFARIENHQA